MSEIFNFLTNNPRNIKYIDNVIVWATDGRMKWEMDEITLLIKHKIRWVKCILYFTHMEGIFDV